MLKSKIDTFEIKLLAGAIKVWTKEASLPPAGLFSPPG